MWTRSGRFIYVSEAASGAFRVARLLYTDHSGRQMAHELDPGRAQTVIGRQAACDVVIADTSVSRRHCMIVPEGSGFAVVDLDSANGTLVNGERVTQRHLVTDDVIRCGVYDVRFIAGAPAVSTSLAERYRRARSSGASSAETPPRGQSEQLQALAEAQARRLTQLTGELSRIQAEWAAADERAARAEVESRALRQRMAALEDHLRQLLAALEQRERELEAMRVMSEPPPPPPAELGPPPLSTSDEPLAAAALAASNVALRAEVSALQTELAVDDAYDRAARLVPTVDRWEALTVARDEIAKLRREVSAAGEPTGDDAEARRWAQAAEAETERLRGELRRTKEQLGRVTTRAEAAERRLREGEAAKPAQGSLRRSLGRMSAADGPGNTGLLAGLGGLGRTAPAGRREGSLTERLSALNTQSRALDERDATIRELRVEVTEQRTRLEQAAPKVKLLGARLSAFREAADVSGMSAVRLAELVDLASAIASALDEPTA